MSADAVAIAASPEQADRHGHADDHRRPSSAQVSAVADPANAMRAAAARITAVEHELAEARAALSAAEAAIAAVRQPAVVPDAYTIDQVAQTLGLSRSKVAEMIRRGDIRSVKLGGSRRVFRADLDAYIAGVRGQAS